MRATENQNLRLIVDGGGENRDLRVKQLETRGHFIEIHTLKLKIEIYAPLKITEGETNSPEEQKATGTDGVSQNFKKGGSILPFDPTRRVGASTVGNGAPGRT